MGPYRACGSLELRFPGRCPGWMSLPLRGGIPKSRQHQNGAPRGFPVPVTERRGSHKRARHGRSVAGFDVAPSVRRPEGAVTNQPRATPWEHVHQPTRAMTGRNRIRFFTGECDVATAENCGALTGHALPWNPGSQGVALGWHVVSPSGRNSESRNIKTDARGSTISRSGAACGPTLIRRASEGTSRGSRISEVRAGHESAHLAGGF